MFAWLIGGCSTTPEASRASDADAKRFESVPRAAIIYVYRPDIRGGVSTVWVDGRLVGQTVSGTYFRVPVRPGRNVIATSGGDMGRIEINTREESVYFVEMQVRGDSESDSATTSQKCGTASNEWAIPAGPTACAMIRWKRPDIMTGGAKTSIW